MRNAAYEYIAEMTGLPEPECHMSRQTDLAKLRLIEEAAKAATTKKVRRWALKRKQAASRRQQIITTRLATS